MVTNGYLLMFGPEHAEEQYKALENHKECEAGTKNIKGTELSKFNNPYGEQKGIEDYQLPSLDDNYQTFCGT